MVSKGADLIKTINDYDVVEDFSEDSDEVHFKPKKNEKKHTEDFCSGFEFGIQDDNLSTSWNDVRKYVRLQGQNKLDDKIKQRIDVLKAKGVAAVEKCSESDYTGDSLSEDEVKVKRSSVKKLKKAVQQEEVQVEDYFEDCPQFRTIESFQEMNLSRPLMKAIAAMQFVHPTPIQNATIPVALLGKDVCGCAATGTGKTAAYMLPTLERLLYRPTSSVAITRVLVLVPTRELGVQVYEVTKRLASYTNVEVGLAVGGLDLKVQEVTLRRNPDVVIATPGRLIDHLKNTASFSLDSVEVLVLDEADRMLDEYFAAQMTEIINQCARTRQTLLFSATMTEEVKQLAAVSLKKPVKIFVNNNQDVANNLRQEFVRIHEKLRRDRECVLCSLICRTFCDHVMVFVQTKKQAHRLHILLGLLGVKVSELHGNLTQPQRLEALRRFREAEIDVLVATDVAARGLDIVGVKTVINFTMPRTFEHYIHRVGRTARAGRSGVSVSLIGQDEYKIVKEVIKNASLPPKSRVIPLEVVQNYRQKVKSLEKDVEAIMQEEYEERALLKMECQAEKAEKILKGEIDPSNKREWFQTPEERKEEKKKFKLTNHNDKKGSDKQNKANKRNNEKKGKRRNQNEDPSEDRVDKKFGKVQLLQARMVKKNKKPRRISAMAESQRGIQGSNKSGGSQKKKKSSFAEDLTDVSRKGVKRLRYEANVQQKLNKLSSKPGGKKGFKSSHRASSHRGKRK